MKINTKRLALRALSSAELELYVSHPKRLTAVLGLSEPLMPLNEHFKKVYHLKSKRIEDEPSSLLYNTYFIIILKESQTAIGSLGLKGKPDADGLVEVGYAIDEDFQNNGYMKEALEGFLEWVLKLKEVSGVNACTSRINIASQRVLMACGFDLIYTDCDLLVWRYTSI